MLSNLFLRRMPSYTTLKNWRPITFLNTDYKIAAKAIANRVKSVLPRLINYNQTGFMKGSFIGENIRLIDCIIQYAKEKNIPGLLVFIDFEKAFDSLEWSFILDTLRFFGFGISIIHWVRVFYNKTESCVLSNGWASNFFETQRGVGKAVLYHLIYSSLPLRLWPKQ